MKNDSLVVPAPAKINLSLAITDKRADGFHGLATVFQSISLSDRVEVKLTKQGITCWCGSLSGKENLAYKAAQAFFQQLSAMGETKSRAGVEIKIDKRIPWQAGLGGGSSDAAAVLRALNTLLDNALSTDQLLQCAKLCGSDTAFCLRGGTQWGEGTGTDLSDLPPCPEMHLLLVKPTTGVNTAEAYKLFDKVGNFARPDKKLWVELLQGKDLKQIGENLTNSLETAAFQLLPEIRRIKEQLIQGGCLGSLMSGSGSTVFGILQDESQGKRLAAQFAKLGIFQTCLVKTIGKAIEQE